MNNKRIILVGNLGHGKTTLFNKICNKNIMTYYGGNSCTRQAFLSKSAYGLGFEVLDTPGLGSYEDRISHVVGIYNALIDGPVHQIVVVIKYERIAIMKGLIKQMIQRQFNRFRDIITVAVTFWDMNIDAQNKLQDKIQILEMLKQFNVSRVAFISKHDSGESVCQTFDEILINSINEDDIYLNLSNLSQSQILELEEKRKKRQILLNQTFTQFYCFKLIIKFQIFLFGKNCFSLSFEKRVFFLHLPITITELESYFDLIEIEDELLNKLNTAQGHIIVKVLKFFKLIQFDCIAIFRKKGKNTIKFIENFPEENKLMPEVMHKLCLMIEQIVNYTLKQLLKRIPFLILTVQASLKEENYGYYLDAQLKKAITQDIRDLKYKAQQKMSKSKSHFLNFIKKCPNCGLIWMKVYGCNGTTTCGRVPEKELPEFIQSKQPQKFEIKINENSVYYQEFQLNQTVTENYDKISSYYQGKIGCGKQLVWSELPPLDENYLRELLDPDVLSYLKLQFVFKFNQLFQNSLQRTMLNKNQKNKLKKQ